MNTSRRRSAKGKWHDAMFPVKWPTYAGSMVGATPSLLYGDGEAAETVGGHAQKKGVLEDDGRLIKTHEL